MTAVLLFAALALQAGAPITDPDAYAIYSAVIPSEWTVREAHAKRLVILDTTQTFPDAFHCGLPKGKDMKGPWQEAEEDYVRQNASPRSLLPQFTLTLPYTLESKDTIMGLFVKGGPGWQGFNDQYPDSAGYLDVSAVGFDADHTHALVYVGHSCGGLCGGGTYHFLQKTDGAWRPVKLAVNTCSWVS